MNSNIAKTCAFGVATLIMASSVALGASSNNRTPTMPRPQVERHPGIMVIKLSCEAYGTPTEFPDDIALTNTGVSTIPAGTKVHWSMADFGKQGNYTFASAVQPNHHATVTGVLGSGVEAGHACTVVVKS